MPGIQSGPSAAAQSGAVQFAAADQQGNLATTNLSQQTIDNLINGATNLSNLQNQVAGIQNQVNILKGGVQKSFEGTAIAIAMGGGWLPDNKIFAIATNLGNFQGQNAMRLNAYYRVSPNIVVNGGVGAGFQHKASAAGSARCSRGKARRASIQKLSVRVRTAWRRGRRDARWASNSAPRTCRRADS